MLELILRENMKKLNRVLLLFLYLLSVDAFADPVSTTLGSNLTAYNPTSGSINNTNWNNFVNARSSGSSASAPTADFSNCNSLILRCTQPKCANGGCTSMEIARPIVSGCVESNEACKEYGVQLVETIAAQLVANSTAKANQKVAEAQVAAAQASPQQSAQQLQQMQTQMQQMQAQMQQQSAETAAQLQAALAEQQQLTAQAIAQANTAAQSASLSSGSSKNSGGLVSDSINQISDLTGVSADALLREQVSGEILAKIENAEVNLKKVEESMKDAFNYAGCDSSGNNCTGPKRVKTFKQKAMNFFDPYNAVLDELYDALILAQTVGVDITDIYMMLNGTCNVWGQYLCDEGQVMHYNNDNCINGRSVNVTTVEGTVRGGAECTVGQVVPMSDGGCQLIKMLTDEAEVERNWLNPKGDEDGVQIRVGCASESLDNSTLFRNRKKQASIDIEVLQRMIEQDAPSVFGGDRFGRNKSANPDGVKYCAVGSNRYQDLQKNVALKTLPQVICVADSELESIYNEDTLLTSVSTSSKTSVYSICGNLSNNNYKYDKCICNNSPDKNYTRWDEGSNSCKCSGDKYVNFDIDLARCVDKNGKTRADETRLEDISSVANKNYYYVPEKAFLIDFCWDYEKYGAKWDESTSSCDCSGISEDRVRLVCEKQTSSDSANK